MWLNEFEEKEYGPFSNYINNNEGSLFRFELNDGAILIVEDDSGDFESDNGLGIKDVAYEEYWERSFKIVQVIRDEYNKYNIDGYILINYHCIPNLYTVNK